MVQLIKGKYKLYDFKAKYGKKPSDAELLKIFDEKLLACLSKLRESNLKNQEMKEEMIACYQEKAVALRKIFKERRTSISQDALARSIDMFDVLLTGKQNEENDKQLLLLARDLSRDSMGLAVGSALIGLAAATFLVISLVFAIPTSGVFLLFLIDFVPYAAVSGLLGYMSYESAKASETTTSLVTSGQSLFSSVSNEGAVLNPLQQLHDSEMRDGAEEQEGVKKTK